MNDFIWTSDAFNFLVCRKYYGPSLTHLLFYSRKLYMRGAPIKCIAFVEISYLVSVLELVEISYTFVILLWKFLTLSVCAYQVFVLTNYTAE